MSIMSRIGRIAADYRAARARYQTELSVNQLAPELQRDIGWPNAYRHNTTNKVVIGGWY